MCGLTSFKTAKNNCEGHPSEEAITVLVATLLIYKVAFINNHYTSISSDRFIVILSDKQSWCHRKTSNK